MTIDNSCVPRGFGGRARRTAHLLVPLSLLLFCSAAFGQQRISGTVLDRKTGAPIAGAPVRLQSDLLSNEKLTSTDDAGRFAFGSLSPGRYTITASAEKYYAEGVTITLAPREVQQVSFGLSPFEEFKEALTVQASSKLLDETESSTATTIARDRIETLPAGRRVQLTDIIAPFVASAVGSHDNLVHLRGNELSLNTFINGVSFFDNPHQLFTPGLSPDVIQSMNVITGGFPAEFGNRFGGVLDIVTRSGFDANGHGTVALSMGDYLRDNASIDYGGHTQRFGYFLYAQAYQSDRFLNTPQPERFHDRGKGTRTFAQLDYRLGSTDFFKLLVTADGSNLELPNTIEDESVGRDFGQRNREQSAVLSWDHTLSKSSMLSTSLYERFVTSRLLPTSDPVSIQARGLRNDLTFGIKSDYSLYADTRHSIKTGIDVMLLRLREDVSFDPREQDFELEPFDFRGRKTGGQASAYFQDQIKVFKNFSANLGLRYDQYSLVTSGHALSPRINLAYALNGRHTVIHFAYNRFFSPPPIENLLLSSLLGFESNPPRISRSNHVETGISHSIRERLVIRLTGYWRSDMNSFETTELANVRIFVPTTFDKGKAYGLEFSAQLAEIKRLGLSGYFSYTAQRAFQTGPVSGGFTVEDVEAGQRGPAAFDQIHTAVAGLNWRERHSGIWASFSMEYGSGTPASIANSAAEETTVRLPEHFTANAYIGVDLFRRDKRRVGLQFNAENITNRVYAIAKESDFTPVQFSAPRFFSASIKFEF